MIAYGISCRPNLNSATPSFERSWGKNQTAQQPSKVAFYGILSFKNSQKPVRGGRAADISGKPIRFKPVERDTLDVRVGDVACQDIVYGDPYIICQFDVSVKNTLHHQVVDRALVHLRTAAFPYERSGNSLGFEPLEHRRSVLQSRWSKCGHFIWKDRRWRVCG